MSGLRKGDFVQVRKDADFRAGQDGLVVAPPDDAGELGMVFAYDRNGDPVGSRGISGNFIHGASEGVEAWNVDELDLDTVDPAPGP